MEPRPVQKLRCALALAGLAGTASAQLELSYQEGVLGYGLEYHLAGDPGELYFVLPSFQTGPVPLSLFEPGQAGVLEVGLDLVGAAFLGQLDALGAGLVELPSLPTAPALVGQPLRAQAFTFSYPPLDIDDLSNPVELTLQLPGSTHLVTGDMVQARRFATLTTLDDGRVLVAGGRRPGVAPQLLADWELFDPELQRFFPGSGQLPQPRAHHRATLLENGRAILTGGIGPVGVHATVVGYDPTLDLATNVAPMNVPRVLHTATRLGDGRVFVAGGAQAFTEGHPIGWPASVGLATETTEIYDPQTNTWTFGPPLPFPLLAHGAVLLGDGRVVIAGGIEVVPGGPVTTSRAYLFDPAAGTLTRTTSMDDPRFHQGTSGTTTGDALFVGGTFVDFGALVSTVHDDTWRFDAQQELWITHPPMLDRVRCGGLGCITYLKHDEDGNKIACTIYLFGGGLRSLDIATGAGVSSRKVMQLKEDFSAWAEVTDLSLERLGTRMAPVDDGIRFLFVGSADVPSGSPPDRTADVVTILP